MSNIDIYTKTTCAFSRRAKDLLRNKGVTFNEIAIDDNSQLRDVMVMRSKQATTPQIFIDNRHIGGYDDLSALDQRGELDPLL
ncbi:glutaredoxin 3 [Streptomyces sp. NPDC006656]|uniref:glutaredoxin 3 n=1 Tax=Streptomyces sp. NPDC006656 TaxID=3156899 RepID=UPI003454864E